MCGLAQLDLAWVWQDLVLPGLAWLSLVRLGRTQPCPAQLGLVWSVRAWSDLSGPGLVWGGTVDPPQTRLVPQVTGVMWE